MRDTLAGTTIRISTDAAGNQADAPSINAAISADGGFVAFTSWAGNLVPGTTAPREDVYIKNVQTGDIARVSADSTGNQANGDSVGKYGQLAISGDGRYVAFDSGATNLVPATGMPLAVGRPSLTLSREGIYWQSYRDYADRLLNVDYKVTNSGEIVAFATSINGSSASNGVTATTTMPLWFDPLVPGDAQAFTVRYKIPEGVVSFTAQVTATAQDAAGSSYSY